jgi:hypothetical protein
MEGKHTIDIGVLMLPVLVELMMTLAEANDVEYVSGMSREKEMRLSNAQIALGKKQGLLGEDMKMEEDPMQAEEQPQQKEEMGMGLMSRREQ